MDLVFVSLSSLRVVLCDASTVIIQTHGTGRGGNLRSVDDVLSQAQRYRSYWGTKGGITVSGGEALLQIQPLTELFRKAKALGINTCLDTSAQPFNRESSSFSAFEELMKYTDLVLLDIKHN